MILKDQGYYSKRVKVDGPLLCIMLKCITSVKLIMRFFNSTVEF